MKRVIRFITIAIILSILMAPLAFAGLSGRSYTDSENKVYFNIPLGWEEKLDSAEGFFIGKGNFFIGYLSSDCYPETTGSEDSEESDVNDMNRMMLNNSFLTTEKIAIVFNVEESEVSKVKYNGNKYFKIVSKEGPITLAHISDGIMYAFVYNGTESDENYSDFESVLNSVEYPSAPAVVLVFLFTTWFVVLFIALYVQYSLPFFIFMKITKKPLPPAKALKIALFYSSFFAVSYLLVFFLKLNFVLAMGIFLGNLILLAFFTTCNYRLLKKGYVEGEEPQPFVYEYNPTNYFGTRKSDLPPSQAFKHEPIRISINSGNNPPITNKKEKETVTFDIPKPLTAQNNQSNVCTVCGAEFKPDSSFCIKCGAEITKQEIAKEQGENT